MPQIGALMSIKWTFMFTGLADVSRFISKGDEGEKYLMSESPAVSGVLPSAVSESLHLPFQV